MLWNIELILYKYMTSFQCKTYQVPVSSVCVNHWRSYALFGSENTWNTQFSALFSEMLWHIELKFFIILCLYFTLLKTTIECRQYLYTRLQTVRILVRWCLSGSPSVRLSVLQVFVRLFTALFSYMLWHIELNFSYHFFKCTSDQVRMSLLCVNY